jgi:hypothetical protein
MFEQRSIHASAGKSRSRAVLTQRPRVTFVRYFCLHFVFNKIQVALNFEIYSTLDNRWPSALTKKIALDSGSKQISFVHSG